MRPSANGSLPPPASFGWIPPLGLAWWNGRLHRAIGWFLHSEPLLEDEDPLAFCLSRVGVAWTMLPAGSSFVIGYSAATHVIVPRAEDGTFYFRYRGSEPESASFHRLDSVCEGERAQ